MSVITEVLVCGMGEPTALNEWLLENDPDRRQQLQKIDMDAAGGTKVFVIDVWAAALNYAPVGTLDAVKRLLPPGWAYIVKIEDDELPHTGSIPFPDEDWL